MHFDKQESVAEELNHRHFGRIGESNRSFVAKIADIVSYLPAMRKNYLRKMAGHFAPDNVLIFTF